jgi:hypothetical protein
VTAHQWLAVAAVLVLAAGGYRYSLWRHPTRKCHSCGGSGKHSGALFSYASGPCTGKTVLPPRGECSNGRVPRWGVRLLKLSGRKGN